MCLLYFEIPQQEQHLLGVAQQNTPPESIMTKNSVQEHFLINEIICLFDFYLKHILVSKSISKYFLLFVLCSLGKGFFFSILRKYVKKNFLHL